MQLQTLLSSSVIILLSLSLVVSPLFAMEKMTDAELRQIVGQKGFFNSEQELNQFKKWKDRLKSIVKSQGFDSFLSKQTRQKLFNGQNMKVREEVEVVQTATRELLMNKQFLKQAAEFGKSLAQLSLALSQKKVPAPNF